LYVLIVALEAARKRLPRAAIVTSLALQPTRSFRVLTGVPHGLTMRTEVVLKAAGVINRGFCRARGLPADEAAGKLCPFRADFVFADAESPERLFARTPHDLSGCKSLRSCLPWEA